MKKIVWNLEKMKAVPVSEIKEFNIFDSRYSEKLKAFSVEIYYTVCVGCNEVVFTADTIEECRKFIESLCK